MNTRYKAMIDLSAEERRGLNTFAAIHSVTPNVYVAAALRERLERDAETFGLPIGPAAGSSPLPGQLELDATPAQVKADTVRRRRRNAQEESGAKRRTSK